MKFKTIKQSLIDWQVTRDGESYGWITRNSDGLYVARFNGSRETYPFIRYKDAVTFVKTF